MRKRDANFDRELAVWFEEVFAPAEPTADAAAEPDADDWPEEAHSGRIPFLIF